MGKLKRIRLSNDSYLLYDWLYLYKGGASSNVNFQEFRAWAENHTGDPYTIQQVRAAIAELEGHELIVVEAIRIKPNDMDLDRFYPGV